MIKQLLAYLLVSRSESSSGDLSLIEKRQFPTDPLNFNDSFYFTGHDEHGTFLITRLGFRAQENTEVWFDMNVPGLGTLTMPNTTFDRGDDITWGPLEYRCKEPGKSWHICYDGPLILDGRKKIIGGLDLLFEGSMPVFNFKKDGDTSSIARSLAQEKWSRDWFMKLKDISQVHYEQGGTMRGTLRAGKRSYTLDLRAMRDHSFGTRDWNAMNRHVWLAALLENGEFINISLVSYDFLSFMTAGYIARGEKIFPVTRAGDFGRVPYGSPLGKAFVVPFDAGKKMKGLELICNTTDCRTYPMGGSYTIHEGIADFVFNTIKGRGICEFGYNNSRC
jgi:hypothetical protein